jgi:tetratricopeptide (TPR) repeat protein
MKGRQRLSTVSFILAALALVLAGGFLVWRKSRAPAAALPTVAIDKLDPVSARLLERHLDAVRATPRSGAAWGKLGAVLRSFELRDEARRCLEIAEQLDPKEPRWHYYHALLLETESPLDAIAALRRAVQLCGNDPDAPRLRLAKLLAESGRGEDARHELEELLRAKPDQAAARLALAHIARARGDLQAAAALAQQCTEDRRTARAAWSLLALLRQRLGDAEAARQASNQAELLPPDAPAPDPFENEVATSRADPRDLSDRAQKLLTSRRLADATPLIQKLVRDHADFSEGWLLQGRLQLLQKDLVAAEQSIRHYLQMEPQSVNGLFQLGLVQLASDRVVEAAETFERATTLKPDFGPAFFNLGLALSRAGRKREAMQPFREAIRHNPERIDSYLLLADLCLQFGEHSEAAELARRAASLDPQDRRLPALNERIARH